ncbi:MAG TPA: amidohydrolase, partial [Bacteroidales bacterium]|nr:amidohydrolase [Bacteroidales bacterium]
MKTEGCNIIIYYSMRYRHFNRRKFLRDTLYSAAGIMMGSNIPDLSGTKNPANPAFDIMKEVMKYRKIDAHEHVGLGGTVEAQIDFADRLNIEKLVISKPIPDYSVNVPPATPEEFRKCNDEVLSAMKRYPDRYLGQVYVNPVYGEESLEEIKRCVDQGMVGLKVYYQVKINDPLFYPVIEKMIDLKMIILMHAVTAIGFAGHRPKYGNQQMNASAAEDFVEAAKRYPEAMFQYAHTGGGGDWEYTCKTIRNYPNIYVDTSGSNNEGSMIDAVLKYLGEDRM